MMDKNYIETLIKQYLEDTTQYMVDLNISLDNQIHVSIDGDDGVTISDCVAVSRFIEQQIDRDKYDYALEVSSYGLSNPLLLPRQYKKNIGKKLSVLLTTGETKEGMLTGCDDEKIDLIDQKMNRNKSKIIDEQTYSILYQDIDKAIVKIEI